MAAAVPEGRILRRLIARRFTGVCFGCAGALLISAAAGAQDVSDYRLAALGDITSLSLEALMEIDVTSVSKRPENISGAAAAIYVLTSDDIRRSGAYSLPEVLRLVPGLTVSRLDGKSWQVTARGFQSTLADKLEVLIDGRSIYTPLYSGVFWEHHDLVLEDIDRIEVIRGPGATLWGANAVNGVINIVTKSAGDTQGAYLKAAASDGKGEFQHNGSARYGGRFGDNLSYRAYIKSFESNDQSLATGEKNRDSADNTTAGFRLDWDAQTGTRVTFQGDVYEGGSSVPPSALTGPFREQNEFDGFNVLGRIAQRWSPDSDTTVQVYFDHTHRKQPVIFEEDRDTWDIDIKHRQRLSDRHELVFGGGYRHSADDIESPLPFVVNFTPAQRDIELINLFLQDQITLVPDRLRLTLGSKFEKNHFTGYEVQPSVRLAYSDERIGTVWTAVSRAVRTPNRLDDDVFLAGFIGNRNFDSEELTAYELGYRHLLRNNVNLDIASYYNEYDKLRGVDPTVGPLGQISNEGDGRGYGVEAVLTWQPTSWWRLEASHNWQHLNVKRYDDSLDTSIAGANRSDPHNQSMLKSRWSFGGNWQLDAIFRHVSGLEDREIHGYSELDIRLAWMPVPRLEFELVGNNLMAPAHPEFDVDNEIERGIIGAVTWRFP